MFIHLNMPYFAELLPSLHWALDTKLLTMEEASSLVGELITTYEEDPEAHAA